MSRLVGILLAAVGAWVFLVFLGVFAWEVWLVLWPDPLGRVVLITSVLGALAMAFILVGPREG